MLQVSMPEVCTAAMRPSSAAFLVAEGLVLGGRTF